MRRISSLLVTAVAGLICAAPASSQAVGDAITLAGCLVQEEEDGAVEFLLTNVTGATIEAEKVELMAAEGVNLAPHVGHSVEVSGMVIGDDDDEAEDDDDDDDDDEALHMRVDKMGHKAASCGSAS